MMEYKRLTKLSDLGTLHALDFNGEEQPLCELTALDIDVLIGRLYEMENKIESGELGDVKEEEHRAATAERALMNAVKVIIDTCEANPNYAYFYNKFLKKAEKELAEEKDGNVNKW